MDFYSPSDNNRIHIDEMTEPFDLLQQTVERADEEADTETPPNAITRWFESERLVAYRLNELSDEARQAQ